MKIPRVLFSAGSSDSGKTIVTSAILNILSSIGYRVQPFKVGPDYIDPMYHRLSSGRPCSNLDSWIMDERTIVKSFALGSKGSDLTIIEGVRGLYEGESPVGDEGSTAHIAKLLGIPVVIVLNCHSLTRSAAAQLMGLKMMDPEVNIAGVILNKISDSRHEEKLRRAISYYTRVPVLGALPRSPVLEIKKRHLGLTTSHELPGVLEKIKAASDLLKQNLDLDALISIAEEASDIELEHLDLPCSGSPVKVGVFMDAPFSFYYHDNLSALRDRGAEIVPLDSLSGTEIGEDISGVIIGGGYPELFSRELEENSSMRKSLKERIMDGMPAIAECGGLMYLCKSIDYGGAKRKMVGVFDGEVVMCQKPNALSYVQLAAIRDSPVAQKGEHLRGHEFHYSRIEGPIEDMAFNVLRGKGIRDAKDGLLCHNSIGMYTHLHYLATPQVPEKFLETCRLSSRR
ncbi:MAG: cobyrinate a,c-diamide synthase [Candidatus Methanosuratincola sp.]